MDKTNTNKGYIFIHKRLLEWEWYTEPNTFKVFMHCLLKANYKENTWRGVLIERGCFISSYANLAKETGLSIRNVRTALKNLKKTNEVTSVSHSSYTLFKVSNYDEYQLGDKQSDKQNDKQSDKQNDKQVTTTNKNTYYVSIKYIVEQLNFHAKKSYKAETKKTQQLIESRLRDGYTEEDFVKVIITKSNEWLGTEMEKYLRPETLFGNKFESYLNQGNPQGEVKGGNFDDTSKYVYY